MLVSTYRSYTRQRTVYECIRSCVNFAHTQSEFKDDPVSLNRLEHAIARCMSFNMHDDMRVLLRISWEWPHLLQFPLQLVPSKLVLIHHRAKVHRIKGVNQSICNLAEVVAKDRQPVLPPRLEGVASVMKLLREDAPRDGAARWLGCSSHRGRR